MRKYLPILAMCTGCVMGAGPVVGYGEKRGFFGAAAGHAGVMMGHATVEVGGNQHGGLLQTRVDLEGSKLRHPGWSRDEDTLYPGLRAGIGYQWGGGESGTAAMLGSDLGVMTANTDCTGAPIYYAGIEWRHVAGESQVVIAPRYEQLHDLCLR